MTQFSSLSFIQFTLIFQIKETYLTSKSYLYFTLTINEGLKFYLCRLFHDFALFLFQIKVFM